MNRWVRTVTAWIVVALLLALSGIALLEWAEVIVARGWHDR